MASGDFTTLGGMDRANHAQARFLAGRGDDVHLVAHRLSNDLTRMPNVHAHRVPRPAGAHLLGAPLLARETERQSRALGRGVHTLVNGGNAAGSSTWIHYLHAAHDPPAASVRSRLSSLVARRYYLRRERAVVGGAALVICNSRRTAEDVQHHYRIADSRLRVVYYGVDASAFGAVTEQERAAARATVGVAAGRKAAVFIGALGDRRKGFDALFDAWRILAAETAWDVDLLVAGTGAERSSWERRCADAGLGTRIRFLGFRADVATVIAAADVLVHPARYEAYGLGVHEAICRGVPAIVAASAGVAERYPAALRDLLIEPAVDATVVARTLRHWRADAEAWPGRVAPFSASLRGRSWDQMAAEIAGLVEAVT